MCVWGLLGLPSNPALVTQVLEETGYDLGNALREEDSVEVHIGQKRTKLYIVGGVDEATHFAPQVRKARQDSGFRRGAGACGCCCC